jgi:hypothetical protein
MNETVKWSQIFSNKTLHVVDENLLYSHHILLKCLRQYNIGSSFVALHNPPIENSDAKCKYKSHSSENIVELYLAQTSWAYYMLNAFLEFYFSLVNRLRHCREFFECQGASKSEGEKSGECSNNVCEWCAMSSFLKVKLSRYTP